jgi:hypothetical protein
MINLVKHFVALPPKLRLTENVKKIIIITFCLKWKVKFYGNQSAKKNVNRVLRSKATISYA